jgi:hypothetical protein
MLISRINVDLDSRDINDMLKCLRTLKKHDFVKDLMIKPSPGGKGFHVQAWHTGDGVEMEELLRIRRLACDDKIRCYLDSKTGRQIGVLFSKKEKRNYER